MPIYAFRGGINIMFVNFNWPSVQKHINGAKNFENKKFQTEQEAI